MPSIADLVLPAYYVTLVVLALYGLHRAALLALYHRHSAKGVPHACDGDLPRVTVQLPLYNERFVAPRLIAAVCRLDYPAERLEIQVLDDSTDETTALVRGEVDRWRGRGIDIRVLHREHRRGFKAGALELGLADAQGDLVAVFDADFVPPSDFLRRTVAAFDDPEVGMVQARWEHLNRDDSLLTRLQAVLLDGHFVIEHAARARSGRFFNFNGTAGIWRRAAIIDAGGWHDDTLTEDLDLSYRAQLRGWRFVYLQDLDVPSELPRDIAAFKTQQHRWAKGSIQTARKLLGPILFSAHPWRRRLEAAVHLTSNLCYPLMVWLSLLIFPAMVARRGGTEWRVLAVDLPLFLAATVSVVAYYLAGQRDSPTGERRPLRILPAALSLGIGLSVNNARAVLAGLCQRGGTFERTPKYHPASQRGRRSPYRARLSWSFAVEGLLGAYFLACCVAAVELRMWFALPFLCLFLQGYGYVFLLSLLALRRDAELRPALARSQAGTAA